LISSVLISSTVPRHFPRPNLSFSKKQFFKKAPFQTNNPNRHEEEEEEQLWSKL